MESAPSLENVQELINFIRVFPIQAQVEFIQLINELRLVAEITVTSKSREVLGPAIKVLEGKGFQAFPKEFDRGIVEYFVSRDPSLAKEAVDILNQRDSSGMNHRRFGELMGFPPGSIESFVNKDEEDYLDFAEIRQVLGFENYFFNLVFSRRNLPETLKYLKDSYRVLLEQAPHIFDEGLPVGEDVEVYKQKVAEFVNS